MVKYRQIMLDNQHWVVGNGHDINIFEDSLVLDVHPLRTWVLHSKNYPSHPEFPLYRVPLRKDWFGISNC